MTLLFSYGILVGVSYPSLRQTLSKFASEETCDRALTHARWPQGVSCPKCHRQGLWHFPTRGKTRKIRYVYQCQQCRHQFSARVGTLFENSHLPLTDWWLVIYLMDCSKMRVSAKELQRMLGVGYETAWSMRDRVQRGMEKDRDFLRKLIDVIPADPPNAGPEVKDTRSKPYRTHR